MIRGLFLAALAVGSSSAAASSSNGASAYVDKDVDRCTTMAVGRLAGKFGPMNTHTADCADCDFRVSAL
jgi:hypothetical protein